LGTLNPVRRLADLAHQAGATVSIDACQLAPHVAMNVVELGGDFVSFSAHKMCGPTGIGVLWGTTSILEETPPFLGGGGMIENVTLEGFTTAALPAKFEAGTPPIAEAIGLAAAIGYLEGIGMDAIREHEIALTAYTMRALTERFADRITIHGPSEPSQRGGVFSLDLAGVHPHDISQILDQHGVCVRAGHHCAKPLMRRLGVGSTARASVYLYNDESDVDALVEALAEAESFFAL
jgi:cysteine desulfurase/selenocysteine lyase